MRSNSLQRAETANRTRARVALSKSDEYSLCATALNGPNRIVNQTRTQRASEGSDPWQTTNACSGSVTLVQTQKIWRIVTTYHDLERDPAPKLETPESVSLILNGSPATAQPPRSFLLMDGFSK
jgi:hypothetical protein